VLEYQPITVGNRKSLIVRALCKSDRTGRPYHAGQSLLVVSPQLESGVELPPRDSPALLGAAALTRGADRPPRAARKTGN
jgi:hypothetical protein